MADSSDSKIPFRTAYGPHVRHIKKIEGPSMVKEAFQEECNINNIVARYQRTGVIDHISKYGERYGDATQADFKEAMDIVANAKTMFEELPSDVRAHFDNDPAEFLGYLETVDPEKDGQELYDLGLALNPPKGGPPVKTIDEIKQGSGDDNETPEPEPINPT